MRRPATTDPFLTQPATVPLPDPASPGETGPAPDASDVPDAPDEPEVGPQRRCIVTRERQDKERMIRFVVAPGGELVPDLSARLPGRGIWLSARGDVIELARTRGALAKAARGPVTISPDLLSDLQAALVRRIGEHLGLARRAGQAVAGFSKAREWLEKGVAALVVQAADGSAEERERFLGGRMLPVVAPLAGAGLGAIFGRDHVVHVAVAAGRLADRIQIESERLAGVTARDVGGGRITVRRDRAKAAKSGVVEMAAAGIAGQQTNATSGVAGWDGSKVQADR